VIEPALRRILSSDALREPLRRMLAARPVVRVAASSGTASAVLVPLVHRAGEVHVWLVRRSSGLRRHSGQVAFPGGKMDPTDDGMLATALREAHEEIGLAPVLVDVLGRLDDLVTGTGFTVSPFVGWIDAPFTPVANAAEVARVFAVPLRVFFGDAEGVPPFHGHTVDGELVWGATGKILRDLVALVRGIEPDEE
jgi:8-oxo-dGTP pyrophosphatase MutT (NUDIX family)